MWPRRTICGKCQDVLDRIHTCNIYGAYPLAACCRLRGRPSGRPLLFSGIAMRTFVYVDGFNLYYGALKGSAFKWLNIKELVATYLVPGTYNIARIKYFTARVSGASDPGAPQRQQIYLNALGTVPEVEVHFGSFLAKTIWRPTINLPIAGRTISSANNTVLAAGHHTVVDAAGNQHILPVGQYVPRNQRPQGRASNPPARAVLTEVHSMEEKGSDVNLAAHLLNDAWSDRYDAAVVISNDTDLVTPIRMVAVERGKSVVVVAPGSRGMAKPLQNVATFKRHIRANMLQGSQFPDPIPNTTIRKPLGW